MKQFLSKSEDRVNGGEVDISWNILIFIKERKMSFARSSGSFWVQTQHKEALEKAFRLLLREYCTFKLVGDDKP